MINLFLKNPKNNQKAAEFQKKYRVNVEETEKAIKTTRKKNVSQTKKSSSSMESNTWMNKHVDRLIRESMKFSHCDFKILDIMAMDADERIEKFKEHSNYQKSKLLFRASEEEDFATIISNGMKDLDVKSLGKWYGKGYYFTSFPVYAAEYYEIKHKKEKTIKISDSDCVVLIGALVNTGNIREIFKSHEGEEIPSDCDTNIRKIYKRHKDEEIPSDYDTNYVRVYGTGPTKYLPARVSAADKVEAGSFCICGSKLVFKNSKDCYQSGCCACNICNKKISLAENEKVYHCNRKYIKELQDHELGFDVCVKCFNQRKLEYYEKTSKFSSIEYQVYDEYCIAEETRILPRYLIKLRKVNKIFVWRNTTFDEYPNAPIYEQISRNNVVYASKDSISALKTIECKKRHTANIFVISNSVDGKYFIGEVIKQLKIPSKNVLIFTMRKNEAKQWADPLDVTVTSSSNEVKQFAEQNVF